MKDLFVLDADGHVSEIEEGVVDWKKELPERFRSIAPRHIPFDTGGGRFFIEGKIWPQPYPTGYKAARQNIRDLHTQRTGMWDPKVRVEHMDMEGIDVAVLFGAAVCFGSSTLENKEFGLAMAQAYNNWLARFCSYRPQRLKGIATTPLQDAEAAVGELHRAVKELGHVGFTAPSNIHGKNISHPDYWPVFAEAERLNVPLCIHMTGSLPGMYRAGTERFGTHFYNHLFGHPFEQMIALSCLYGDGVLDRHPKMRVAFLESGAGWLPYWLDRMHEHYEHLGGELKAGAPPRAYWESGQLYISFEVDETTLEATVDLVGEGSVIFASDYWHFDGKFPDTVKTVMERPKLSSAVKRKILGENGARLFNVRNGKH